MRPRTTDPDIAKRLLEAHALAKAGASIGLILQLTRFGKRMVRDLVRNHGYRPLRKRRTPRRWLNHRPQSAHVAQVVLLYECQFSMHSATDKLLRTFSLYSAWLGEGRVLDCDQCAQIIGLYESGALRQYRCSQCPRFFFALSWQALCPMCRLQARAPRHPRGSGDKSVLTNVSDDVAGDTVRAFLLARHVVPRCHQHLAEDTA
jgi:hypothetical protein